MINTKRDRAWRRRQRAVKIRHRQVRLLGGQTVKRGRFSKVKGYPSYGEPAQVRPSKDWRLLYWRSRKLKRAAQLGFEYPRKPWRDLLLEVEDIG
ncbi:hypothetical protein [Acaryochloris sp. CCMEE 5410]|uniref:hypothetical protein n=1 Tax=Acaryochloris sp. CCMEE 5410 TaxID=310037 RepID=UPI00024840A8|nr:hypothetical protein [Acaryochloris sp. CCMEE 5410]KAI9133388.1 hypothetical protein ON05_008780 [Acaryochloris sp. CCMEE 5410]